MKADQSKTGVVPPVAAVYVGIVTYNSAADLPACFAALARQTYPDIRISVLDNASTDETVAWVRQHAPDSTLFTNSENVGFGRAHNQIIAQCKPGAGDFYMPLNPDVKLSDDYIERVVAALGETGAGWASGKLLLPGDDHPLQLYSAGQGLRRDGYVINVGQGMADSPEFDEPREVFLVSGAAPILRGALIAALAPDGELFDSSMFMYAEDIDMGWRARRLGWRCWYVPGAVARHRGGHLRRAMRAQAQANIHISVLKNAYWIDLITCNIPLILVDLLLRLILTPSMGSRVLLQVVRGAPGAFRKRRKPILPRRDMLGWYRWSRQQPTTQQSGLVERVRAYLDRHRS